MAEIGPQSDERRETLADLRQRLAGHWHVPALALSFMALVAASLLAVLPGEKELPPEDLLIRAREALGERRFVLADSLAEEYVRQFPEQASIDPLVHRIQGSSAYELAMISADDAERRTWLNKARAAYAAALPLERDRLPVATVERMGRIALALDEYAEAVTHLEAVIAHDPPHVVRLELLRIEALRKLQPEEDELLLAEVAKARKGAARRLAAMQRDLDASADEAPATRQRIEDRIVELKEDALRLVVVEVEILGQRGDYVQAEQRLRDVLASRQEDETPSRELLLELSVAQGGQGNWTEALDTLDSVLDMSSGAASESADARAHLLKGRALYNQQNYDAAVVQFELAARLFPEMDEGIASRLGLAETLLALEDTERARAVLAEVVPEIRKGDQQSELINLSALRQMLRTQAEMNLLRGRVDDALDFVMLEEAILVEPERDVLLRKAAILERAAEQVAAAAEKAESGSNESTALRLSAELKWREAGDIYTLVAETFDATAQYDYGHSRWAATRGYLKAGAHARTAEALAQFIAEQPLDNRVPQARLDLAREYEVLGRWEQAVDVYRTLIEESPSSLAGFEGRFRLAVALIRGGPQYYDDAEEELLGLVERSDQVLPESMWYRRSLFELGRLMYLRERHDETLMRLSEFIQRYPTAEQSLSAQYLMAQSVRQQGLAALERSRVAEQMLERRAAVEIAQQKLSNAVVEMQRLAEVYDRLPTALMTPLASTEHRSLLFDLADTLSHLERHAEAIAVYDQIVVRYQTSPAAMSAYSRLAAQYRKANQRDQLMAVLERARWTLQKIPEEAFAAEPGMSRAFWEYWLETMQL